MDFDAVQTAAGDGLMEAPCDIVINPERQCVRADGYPKKGYRSFDEAFEQIALIRGPRGQRTHVYRCGLCDLYHLARNRTAPA